MHTINGGWVYGEDGKKLTRTQAYQVLQNVNVERPCEVYLIANQLEDMVKVGISHQPHVRKGQVEQKYPELGKLKLLQSFPTRSEASAREIETSIHAFLNEMDRGPVLDREWFKPKPHDTWLIRYLLNEVPTRLVASIFNELEFSYTDLLAEYKDNPDYVAEEILLGFGKVIYSHFKHETGYQGDVGTRMRDKAPNLFALPLAA